MRKLDWCIVGLLAFGLLALVHRYVPIVLLPGGFLKPAGHLMLAALPVAVFLAVWRGVYRLFGGHGPIPALVSFGLVGVILAMPAYFANRVLDNRAQALVAGDHEASVVPITAETLGLLRRRTVQKSEAIRECRDACLRYLLGGDDRKVVIATVDDLVGAPEMDMPATALFLESRPSCAGVDEPWRRPGMLSSSRSPDPRTRKLFGLLEILSAQGKCFRSAETRLGEADAVVAIGKLKSGVDGREAGFDLFADTLSVDRLAAYSSDGARFSEVFRHTWVNGPRLTPVLLPSVNRSRDFRVGLGLWRVGGEEALTTGRKLAAAYHALFSELFGSDAANDLAVIQRRTREFLQWLPSDAAALPTVTDRGVADYFEGFALGGEIGSADFPVVEKVFAEERIIIPEFGSAAVRDVEGAPAGYLEAIAEASFRRLRAMVDKADGKEPPDEAVRAAIRNLAKVVEALPQAVVRGHRADVDWLAGRGIVLGDRT